MSIEKIKIAENQYVWVDKSLIIERFDITYNRSSKMIMNYGSYEIYQGETLDKIIAATSKLNLAVPTWEEYLAEKETINNEFNSEKSYITGYQKRDEECKEEIIQAQIAILKSVEKEYQTKKYSTFSNGGTFETYSNVVCKSINELEIELNKYFHEKK